MRDWTNDEIKGMADRLRDARLKAGFQRASEAVRQNGWNYSRYMNYENGERAIPLKQALLFAKAFAVTTDYIYFGRADRLNQGQGFSRTIASEIRSIPRLTLDNISDIERLSQGLEPMQFESVPVRLAQSLPKRAIFVVVSDRSMSNESEPVSLGIGDEVLIELGAAPKPGNFVLATALGEDQALIRLYREIERAEDGTLTFDLVPLNQNFRTIRATKSLGAEVLGVCRRIYRIAEL